MASLTKLGFVFSPSFSLERYLAPQFHHSFSIKPSFRISTELVELLVDMDCVGLKPGFSMIEKRTMGKDKKEAQLDILLGR
ncbi:hypothetical protein ACOSP7_024101 [Xanthoceras sorbifolium]